VERRTINSTCEFIEERSGNSRGRFTGLASIYYNTADSGTEFVLWDGPQGRAVERIMPGAFDRALRENDDVIATFNHDMNWPLADTETGSLQLANEQKGLRYRFDFNPDDPQH
jgi:HK97 family phage prohead protease